MTQEPNPEEIRRAVQERYAEAARRAQEAGRSACCTTAGCCDPSPTLYAPEQLRQVPEAAALASLGCANPLAVAQLRPGEVVLDLGSGGGVDVLLCAGQVGPTGKVYGLDMTGEMLELARENARQAGATNVEFLEGHIESIPLPDASVDVIISNCVINLSADKPAVLAEAHRVLRPGGRLAVADVVVLGAPLAPEARQHLSLWADCVSGALTEAEYRRELAAAGFAGIDVQVVRESSLQAVSGCCGSPALPLGPETRIASAFIRATRPAH